MPEDIYSELEWRGLIHQSTDPELGQMLTAEPFTVYCGFDPTAGSLTTAHLLQLLRLRRFQIFGHRPIAVAGGGTGLIGDPSGREAERQLLTTEELEANVATIRVQLESLLDFSAGPGQAILVNNADWLTKLQLTDFLRDVGKHFSVNMMIARESVRARLEDREQGISFTEFSYMLLQSFDFLHLFDEYGCRLQLGGSDQWGNITAGIDLIRKTRGAQAFGLTSPLIVRADGKKMSKSEGGAVWLDPALTSPYQFYQYWINTPDDNAGAFLRYFTFLDRSNIEGLDAADPSTRDSQRALAYELTSLVHGKDEADGAVRAAGALFGGGIRDLDEATLLDVLSEAPSVDVPRTSLDGQGLELVDLLVTAGLARSRGEARTQIEGGGIYLNNQREAEVGRLVTQADLLLGRYLVVRRGKKTFCLARFSQGG